MTQYQHLEVWRVSMDLAEHCYRVTSTFPKEEIFGLTSQIRRAAALVPASIAEGHGRASTKVYLTLLSRARGTLMELESHLLLSSRVGLLSSEQLNPLMESTRRVCHMITLLRSELKKRL